MWNKRLFLFTGKKTKITISLSSVFRNVFLYIA